MADFIAVIRRAVSGLSNNTPEMRAKVYEKARTAVRRQLESMNPRPPEDMLLRQLEKLEAAIAEVDAEYSEALPAIEEAALEAPVFEPAPVEDHGGEPVAERRDAFADEHDAGYVEPETRYAEPEAEPVRSAEEFGARREEELEVEPVAADHAPSFETYAEPAPVATEEPRHEPVHEEGPVWAEEPVPAEPTPVAVEAAWPEREETAPSPEWPAAPAWDEAPQWPPAAEPVEAQTVQHVDVAAAETPAPHWPEPETFGAEREPVREPDPVPAAARVVPEDIDLLAQVHKAAAQKPAEMPGSLDLLDWDPVQPVAKPVQPSDLKDDDFDSWFPKTDEAATAAPGSAVDEQLHQFELDTAASLAGAQNGKRGDSPRAAAPSREIDDLMAATEAKAYRIETKKRRNYTPLLLGLAGLIVVAGGGYAVWSNKDAMSEFVSGLVASAPDVASDGQDQTTDMAEDETPPPETATPAMPGQTPVTTEGESSGRKFTQRLLADGTEVDEGDGNAGVGEGRSVAEQSVPSDNAPTDAAPSGATTPASATPATGDAAAAGTPPAATTASAGEKALIYEERLGQATPTAIPGRVEWTVLREAGADGKPDPSVQGKLVVPDSGLTALITFKRNADSSLPASHLVEIVFSVPATFEGGAVEDVQRVSMKRTEQDRGDPLVAVTAKITDDTFLIALNDFQDVVARNVELMQTRGWIDIPVTYRNGRRALLTLDKGPSGNAAFDSVIKEWAALGKPTGG